MADSPLIRQYLEIKRRHPREILFFHLGDFYETFNEDARIASRVLGIALTARFTGEKRMPMAGVPYRNAAPYIKKLLEAGHRVALCDQVEDAGEVKGRIVERAVVRIITPGTLLEELDPADRRPHYLAAIAPGKDATGLAWVDLSTGAFQAEDLQTGLADEIHRLAPAEILVPAGTEERFTGLGPLTPFGEWAFDRDTARRDLQEHFGVASLDGFGCERLGPGLSAAGALLQYLRETQRGPLTHIRRLLPRDPRAEMVIDRHTQRALDLVETQRDQKVEGSLLGVLDRCETPMGSRRLRAWITAPLRNLEAIRRRQEAVEELFRNPGLARGLAAALRGVGDLERLLARLGTGRATPRDLGGLRDALTPLPELRKLLAECRSPLLNRDLPAHAELRERLGAALVDAPPHTISEGGIFRRGYDMELDRLVGLKTDARRVLDDLARRESERTGIPSLKVGYNSVFGYYIEVTHAHRDRVPPDYVRKQTLKHAERFITAQLKDLETQILNAEESARRREKALFEELRREAAAEIPSLQQTAESVSTLDALLSLARVARERGYVRPEVDDSTDLLIRDGRHPVLETIDRFVPNDVEMDSAKRTLLITGPNMAGKSTYVRQVALITLMAQIGSFVPARSARIGVADRIFARIGASDELQRGVSTFMQEMLETSNILHHATERSLIVLDELGRGTSTFDGVSIAWAVAEWLHQRTRARTLFATHYHELVGLAEAHPGVRNLHTTVREWKERIIFLYKVQEGPANRSYGIHVARLAGIPEEITKRAKVILEQLEQTTARATPASTLQLGLFRLVPREEEKAPPSHPVLEELRETDVDSMTPVQALQKLAEWVREIRGEK